jgi:hypothetical protein
MKAFIISTMLFVSVNCFAQQKTVTGKNLTLVNRNLSLGQDGTAQVIHLDAKDDDGVAWINGQQFTDGTIEVDIKGKDELQHSFVGIAFHGVDNKTFEAIYFRPFNFRATDAARKSHAVQYVALPQYDWSKLRDEHPGQYEKPIDPAPDPNEWFHARIEVQGTSIKVFVNGNATPSLTVEALVHTDGKMIGYWVGNTSDGSWKNLKITADKH